MNVKSLEIKNTSYYFYDDIVHANEFDKNLIKVNKISLELVLIFIT